MSSTPSDGVPGYGPTSCRLADYNDTKFLRWARVGGLKISVSSWLKPVPAVSLSPDFTAASDECIAGMNAWLLEQFGTKEDLRWLNNKTLVVSPKIYESIKDEI